MTATTETPLVQVLELAQAEYRADPRLATHSRVRKTLPPSTPAHAKADLDAEQRQLHGEPAEPDDPEPSEALDYGRAAHTRVLGIGDPVRVITGTGTDPNAWRTKADFAALAEARAEGVTPIRPRDEVRIDAMAAALRQHPLAAALLDAGRGRAEQTILWPDEQIPAVQRGAMVDFLPDPVEGRRLIISDYKTAAEAHPSEWQKSAATYGYHSQAAWLLDGLHAVYPDLGADDVACMFIVQSKRKPYPVAVVELEPEDIRLGRALNTWGIQMWHRCWETGVWPGYGDDVHLVGLPPWYRDRWRPIT